jgi:exopolysaccharide production protein ExoZ
LPTRDDVIATEVPPRSRVTAIDGLRGAAIILVFLVHFSGAYAMSFRGINFDLVSDVRQLGTGDALFYWAYYSHYGVQLFFVVSGFVISRSWADAQDLSRYPGFLLRRVARIYPGFLVSLTIAVLLGAYPSGTLQVEARTFVANLLFLNGLFSLGIPAYNVVTWSLFFEFIFYIFVPMFIVAGSRLGERRLGAIALFLLSMAGLALVGYPEWFLLLPFLFGSAVGLLRAEELGQAASRLSDGILAAAYAVTTTAGMAFVSLPRSTSAGFLWTHQNWLFVLCFSVVATLILVRAGYGNGFLGRLCTARPLQALGKVSFSFFLLHYLVITGLLSAAKGGVDGSITEAVLFGALAFLASYLAACVLYRVAEEPYFRLRRSPAVVEAG